MEITQLPNISDNAGKAFIAPILELLKKYAFVFTKPCKLVARDIKYKIELLDPEKPIAQLRLQIMYEKRIAISAKAPVRMPRERLDTAQYILVQSPHLVHSQENCKTES